MNLQKKISAFTLLEMVISMIIGAIIITLAYGIILQLKNTWKIFQKNQDQIITLLSLKQTIENDADNSEFIQTIDEKNFQFICKQDTIYYTIDSIIIRKCSGQRDLFPLNITKVNVTYIKSMENAGVACKIIVHFKNTVGQKQMILTKYYTSGQLMNLVTNNTEFYGTESR